MRKFGRWQSALESAYGKVDLGRRIVNCNDFDMIPYILSLEAVVGRRRSLIEKLTLSSARLQESFDAFQG